MTETRARRKLILARLQQQGGLHVEDLARELGVSPNTIRNDFDSLAADVKLRRVRGGAEPAAEFSTSYPELFSSAFQARYPQNAEAKDHIAGWAAELVSDGDSILLDAGTTVFYMVHYLLERRDLTVVSSGIEAARVLARNRSNTVLLLGGCMRADGLLVSSMVGEPMLKSLNIGKAFLSCTGYTPEGGLTETNIQEAELKRQMMAAADKIIALIDATKFGKLGLVPFAATDRVAGVYTDSSLVPCWIERMRRAPGRPALTVCNARTVTCYSSDDIGR